MKHNATTFTLSNNLIVVDATLNGVPVPMILDTGAAATIIGKKTADRLGLEKADQTCAALGAGGDVQMDSVKIDSLVVDAVTRRDITSMTLDLSSICERLGKDVDGIIGYDFLADARLSIDYPARQFVLEEAA